jgi:hypothetical protein
MAENSSNDADIDTSDEISDQTSDYDSSSVESGETTRDVNENIETVLTTLQETLNIIDDIGKKTMEQTIEKATIAEFSSLKYLRSSPFNSNKFRVKKEFIEKVATIGLKIEDRFKFSEYCKFLTDYIVKHDLSDEMGIITPDTFLCDLLKLETKPCTFIKLMGASVHVFY